MVLLLGNTHKTNTMRKLWSTGAAGAICFIAVLFGANLVSSVQPNKLADNEQVIVESRSPVEAGQRIGQTDFYAARASDARELRSKNSEAQVHIAQKYKLISTNDPFEPQGYLTLLDASAVWDVTTGSSDTVVAVIDSGVALEHEDLAGRWYANPAESGPTAAEGSAPNCTSRSLPLDKSCNNIDDDSNGFIDDWQGWDFANDDNDPSAGTTNPSGDAVQHGTAVTGMVGATGNNGAGVASLNWNTKFLPLQIFTDDGEATTLEVAEAIAYAIDMGVDVINLSLGTQSLDPVIEGLLEDARTAGIVVVAAAGNCGGSSYAANGCSFQGQMLYPATSSLTLSIVGTDFSDNRASFSSEGSMADVGAPATGAIMTTLYDSGDELGAYSGSIAGTSFATPIVSGLAVSIMALWPDAGPADVRAMMVDTALKVSQMNGSVRTNQHGFGRIRPAQALSLAQKCELGVLAEDINCDGNVNLLDLSILASQWQVSRTGRSDINSSEKTELLDLSLLASKWGS
jgi:subtilisin family serine protease